MKRHLIIIVIAVAIATTMASTLLAYRNARRAADDFLKADALGIASSLDTTLSRYGTGENIFRGIIQSQRWEGIAFLALYAADGTVLMHSNPNLVGRKATLGTPMAALTSESPLFQYRTIGTGEAVFIMDAPIHAAGAAAVLRVALHTYPSLRIVREARFQLISVAAVDTALVCVTVFFLIASRRQQALQKKLIEKEKLSLLGEMSAVLAHEIRNPLGSIKGFGQYLKERAAASGHAADFAEPLDVIVKESGRLEQLTEDLLAYTRGEQLAIESFRINDLVAEVLSTLQTPASVTIETDLCCDIQLHTDRTKLRQVLTNLLQNGLDAIEGSGRVAILTAGAGGRVVITVRDTGSGIDVKTREEIFRPFFTTRAKGTGLGLAIVDRYVTALGGTITVESEPGKGSSFGVSIPLQAPEQT